MATVRLTTKEVQVDSRIYTFDAVWKADAFEACLAAVDVEHCEIQHPPVSVRETEPTDPTPESSDGEESERKAA